MVGAAGCEPPDTPPALADALPAAVRDLLRPDTLRSLALGEGAGYRYLWSPRGPWAVHLVHADLDRCDLALRTLRARPREEGGRGHERVTSMVGRFDGLTLAAVNADFFTPEGGTVGSEVAQGRVTAARFRPALAWRPGSAPWIGNTSMVRDTLMAGWPVPFGEGDGVTELVGGYPELMDRGEPVYGTAVSERPAFAASRQPRTAVAWDADAGRLWLVVVDGRRPPFSLGMTLAELTALLEALGAEEGLNLDGGGSTVMVVRGAARSQPSEAEGERAVANALALVRDPAGCRGR